MSQQQDAEFVIDDPEELSQKTRVRELLQRRKDVLDARNVSKDEQLMGEIGQMAALAHYQNHLETLILDLWTKFHDTENGQKYLHDVEITRIHVPPPADIPTGGDLATGADTPEMKTETIRGLNWFVENEPVVTKSFQVQSWNPPGTQTYTNSVPLQRNHLDKALAKCLEFMNDVGIDADFDEDGEDIIRDFDQSGDDPTAELDNVEYRGDPDI